MKQDYNGNILDTEELLLLQNNRAFLYGDGFFESMRWQNKRINFFTDHIERIKKACVLLKLNLPFLLSTLQDKINTLAEANNIKSASRIRMIMFRISNGTYLPDENNTGYTIIIQPLPNENYVLNTKGLHLGFYSEQTKSPSSISTIKSLNCNVSVLASIYAQENKLDDAILLNSNSNVIEATGSSIYLLKNDRILTPPISDGCADGVMRKQISICAEKLSIEFKEQSLTAQDVINADEVFITNVVKGIQWVEKIELHTFEKRISEKLFSEIKIT